MQEDITELTADEGCEALDFCKIFAIITKTHTHNYLQVNCDTDIVETSVQALARSH